MTFILMDFVFCHKRQNFILLIVYKREKEVKDRDNILKKDSLRRMWSEKNLQLVLFQCNPLPYSSRETHKENAVQFGNQEKVDVQQIRLEQPAGNGTQWPTVTG